jgi:hypothetical protein
MHAEQKRRWIMARPIKPTPVLDPKSARIFIEKVERNQGTKTGPTPTPRLAQSLKNFSINAKSEK